MNTDAQVQDVNVPSKIFTRNKFGLLSGPSAPVYIFNEDGTVNWRKMINPKWLVPNKQKTKETDISKLEDKDLLILLGGIKELAQIRGFSRVNHVVTSPSSDCVVSVCSIKFIGNYETEDMTVEFSAIGDATVFNTTSFGKNFLGPIAENRAFVRCVRNFLKINIVGYEEVSSQSEDPQTSTIEAEKVVAPDSPVAMLQQEMDKRGVKLEHVVARLKEENFQDADKIKCLSDIPGAKLFELIARLKKVPAKS